MTKSAKPSIQFNVKVFGEDAIATIAAVRKYCDAQKISLGTFLTEALSNALEAGLMPEDNQTSNQGIDTLSREAVTELVSGEVQSQLAIFRDEVTRRLGELNA